MFRRSEQQYPDLSANLRDANIDWKPDGLRSLEFLSDITSVSVFPRVFLAVGTRSGHVHIFGRPSVQLKIALDERVSVNLLQFSSLLYQLVAVDSLNQLYVWALSVEGKPKMISKTAFPHQINCITVSPSHNHCFLGMENGEVRTFDLECLRKSPYSIGNAWRTYLDKMRMSGIEISKPLSEGVIDCVVHPRDLSLLFIVYPGGIVLYDLVQKLATRAYELVLNPGAPGGTGYQIDSIFTHRRPSVTSMSIHCAGHFFAAGYEDGCIAFWAIEDEDQPLQVRTLDDIDVNVVNGEELEKHTNNLNLSGSRQAREPIFKISWSGFSNSSDPRGGETCIAVLGGLEPSSESGLSVLRLPAFNPEEPSTPSSQSTADSSMKNAMRQSLLPLHAYCYNLSSIAHDFFLVPKESPHFSGNFDPLAILILRESLGDTRVLDAFEYPPPYEGTDDSLNETIAEGERNVEDDLASTLKAMKLVDDPQKLHLPPSITEASAGYLGGQLMTVDIEVFDSLQEMNNIANSGLLFNGGAAWSDESNASELNLAKYQPRRLLVSWHQDQTVRFSNYSATLLQALRPNPISHSYPELLDSLTIDLNALLSDPNILTKVLSINDQSRVLSVEFSPEALEVAVVFDKGEVVFYHTRQDPTPSSQPPSQESPLISLNDMQTGHHIFVPYFLVQGNGKVTSCALSDVGFVAIAFSDGSLKIIDMRGPRVIHELLPKASKRHSVLHKHERGGDIITSLNWTACATDKDPRLALRLVAADESSTCRIYSLKHDNQGRWSASTDPEISQTVPHPLPSSTFIIQLKGGAPVLATRAKLASILREAQLDEPPSALIVASNKGARSILNLSGERIGKCDWGHKAGIVHSVQIVERMGSRCLVAINNKNDCHVYSLPHLDYLHTLSLPVATTNITIDSSGDFLSPYPLRNAPQADKVIYGTLFNLRRAYGLPDIDLYPSRNAIPPQPQPVPLGPSSMLGSWINKFAGNYTTGKQIDELLAGPNRPPRVAPEPEPPRPSRSATAPPGTQSEDAEGDVYDRLTSAAAERGQMLGDLEDHFNALQQGSQNMLAQAKRLATEQAAKSRFGF